LIIFAFVAIPMLAFLGWVLWRRWSVVVGPRQAGLVIRRGRATTTTLPTGVHFAAPWNQTVEIYPDYELTYMTVPAERLPLEGTADTDYADPPFGVIDQDGVSASVFYTIRFALIRDELKQIHERFGAKGIKGIIRDESRRVIQDAFAEADYRLADLARPSRTPLEQFLSQQIRERLAANGFALIFFSLQEPDLRELGEALREQLSAREALLLEALRMQVDDAKGRRLRAIAQTEAQIEAERLRTRAMAEADAEEERAIRRASTAGKTREIDIARRLELAAMEAELRLKRAQALAQSNSVLAAGLSEMLVRIEAIESWREAMERWDGQMSPGLNPGMPAPPPFLGTLPYTHGPAPEAGVAEERHAPPPAGSMTSVTTAEDSGHEA
jgi:regulator of protease activity HflC (stomatin/prohibitin superfamily)